MNTLIEARTGTPRVPLVDRRDEGLWDAMSDGTFRVIHDQFGPQWRPIVNTERRAADELLEPLPSRAPVVVSRYVEAHPGAAIFHVSLKRLLLGDRRTSIEPDHQLVLLQVLLIHVGPVARRLHAKVVPVRDFGEEAQRVSGKEHV